jgi:hypothetical protein
MSMKKLLTAIASTIFLTFSATGSSVAGDSTSTVVKKTIVDDYLIQDMLLSSPGSTYSMTQKYNRKTGSLLSITMNGCTVDVIALTGKIGIGKVGECAARVGFSLREPTASALDAGVDCVIDIDPDAYSPPIVTGTCPVR